MERPRLRELHATNAFRSRSAVQRSRDAALLTLDRDHSLNFGRFVRQADHTEADFQMTSTATTFARGGIRPGQGIRGSFIRDIHTGVWHRRGLSNPLFLPESQRSSPSLGFNMEMVPLNHLSVTLKGRTL
mmetsp:Transcript_68829/g.149817  ORF Transcript_68829/g.149817 Transcript_68829/m.149817 type:complete len:130 (+) Transcript_68829:42-431(+)